LQNLAALKVIGLPVNTFKDSRLRRLGSQWGPFVEWKGRKILWLVIFRANSGTNTSASISPIQNRKTYEWNFWYLEGSDLLPCDNSDWVWCQV